MKVCATPSPALGPRSSGAELRVRPYRLFAQHELLNLPVEPVDLVMQFGDGGLGLDVDLVVERRRQPIFLSLPVLAHHDDRRLHGGEHREQQVEEDEWIWIE